MHDAQMFSSLQHYSYFHRGIFYYNTGVAIVTRGKEAVREAFIRKFLPGFRRRRRRRAGAAFV